MEYSFPVMDGERVLKIDISPEDMEWQGVAGSYRRNILRTEKHELPVGLSELPEWYVKEVEASETAESGRTNFYSYVADPDFIDLVVSGARYQLWGKRGEVKQRSRDEVTERLSNRDKILDVAKDKYFGKGTSLHGMRQTDIGMEEEENLIDRLYEGNKVVLEFEPEEDFPGFTLDVRINSLKPKS